MYSLPTSVTLSGTEYPIRTDFRVILEILTMLDDPELSDADKTEALLRMFYPERPPDVPAAVDARLNFISPRRPAGRPPQLVDWERDFDLIAGPVNHVLGYECRACEYLHWHTFLSAYQEISPDSLFASVLRLREKRMTGRKLEKDERAWYRKHRSLVDLPVRLSPQEKELFNTWTSKT